LPIPSIRFENLVNDQKINAGPITIHIGLKDLPNNVGSIKLDIAEDPKLEVITPGDTQLQIPLDFSGYSGQDILLKAVLLDNEGKEIALAEPVRVSVAVSNGVPGDDNLGLTPTSTQVMMEEEHQRSTLVGYWYRGHPILFVISAGPGRVSALSIPSPIKTFYTGENNSLYKQHHQLDQETGIKSCRVKPQYSPDSPGGWW
jgi:hypothetical protein